MIGITAEGWHHCNIQLPSVSQYVVNLRMSCAVERLPDSLAFIFLHENRVSMKKLSGGQEPNEAIAIVVPEL